MAPHQATKETTGTKSLGLSLLKELQGRSFFVAHIILRVLAIAFTVAAFVVLVTNNQDVLIFGVRFSARYYYSSAFKFLAVADGVVCFFSLFSLVFVGLLSQKSGSQSHPLSYFSLFMHDLVMMVLMISGCAASTAIGYVGQYGENEMGWGAICVNVAHFCQRSLISMVLSYLAFFCYLGLTVISAHKLMFQSIH